MATILVVEDDNTIREALSELLSEEHTCHSVGTAERALERLEAEPYDVVVTDGSLPGMNGRRLLELIRRQWPNTPVIVISGSDDEAYAKSLTNLGAFEYLVKPFRIEAVEEIVNRAIEHRRELLKED